MQYKITTLSYNDILQHFLTALFDKKLIVVADF